MPRTNFKFQENEKVLCYHGPLLYEAKIQKSQESQDAKDKEKIIKYLVHYLGWSKNWDEWVPEDRVIKINETSLQKQKELKDAQSKGNKNKSAKKKAQDIKETPSSSPSPAVERQTPKTKLTTNSSLNVVSQSISEPKDTPSVAKDTEGQRKKRIKLNQESNAETFEATAPKGASISIDIPSGLKQALVDDWEQINHKKLVRLPAKVTINRIVDDYLKHKLNQKFSLAKESAIKEATEGIKEYFNASIASKLLYPFERNQFKDLIKDPDEDPKPSAVYGGIHLLRLFVKLGFLLSYLNLEEKSIALISGHLDDFLKYLEQNPSLFSAHDNYESPPNDYLKKWL